MHDAGTMDHNRAPLHARPYHVVGMVPGLDAMMLKYLIPISYGAASMAALIAVVSLLVPAAQPVGIRPPVLPPVWPTVDRTHKGDRLIPLAVPMAIANTLRARFDALDDSPALFDLQPRQAERALGWPPVRAIAPATLPAPNAENAPAAAPAAAPPGHHDVCARHGMVRVYADRWRWRCRRA